MKVNILSNLTNQNSFNSYEKKGQKMRILNQTTVVKAEALEPQRPGF